MSAAGEGFAPRRILVALDASGHSLAALDAAAELAARLGAELIGLFVEDVNIVRLARSPLAAHVALPFGAGEAYEGARVEDDLWARSERAQEALTRVAARRGLRFRFRSVPGAVEPEVLEAAGEADLLILGWSGGALNVGGRMGGTARAALERARPTVLLLREGAHLGREVTVLLQDRPGALRLLDAAARLTVRVAGPPTVILVTDSMDAALALRQRASAYPGGPGRNAVYRNLVAPSAAALAGALAGADHGILVMLADSPLLSQPVARRAIDGVRGPLLLVR